MDAQEWNELHHALVQTWNIAPVVQESLLEDELVEALTAKVAFLLQHDYQKLLSALYILDISEGRFQAATAGKDANENARNLAIVIFERELEKLESRRKYRRDRSIDVPFKAQGDRDRPSLEG